MIFIIILLVVLIISLSVLMLLGVSANETQKGSVEFSRDSEYYLNEKGYIVPGLGDAGDRIFGTK